MAVIPMTRPRPLGKDIDALWDLREQKRELQTKVDALDDRIKDMEGIVIERLDAEGMPKANGSKAAVSISESIVFSIEDFDLFAKYLKRSGNFHLFQRRISDPAAREIFEKKGAVPGLAPFTKRRLNLTTVKG